MLFRETIGNWEDWSNVYCSIPAFSQLIFSIYQEQGLPCRDITNLTPGTNAVFRVGDTVIKIFAPKESGQDGALDWQRELAVCRHATKMGIPCTQFIASGNCADAYDFYYIISSYVSGLSAKDAVAQFNREAQNHFSLKILALTQQLHHPCPGLIPSTDFLKQLEKNPRLRWLSPSLQKDIFHHAAKVDFSNPVLVHGDLTEDNVLVLADGSPVLIDFGDSCLAPSCYELPPLVFHLLDCRREMLFPFMQGQSPDTFADKLIQGLSIHDFAANIILEFMKKINQPADSLHSLMQLKQLFLKTLAEGAII